MIKTGLLATALFLSACGGGGDNWGIDYQGGGTSLAACLNNSQDAAEAGATAVPAGSHIKKRDDNTVIRVWHFQNSAEVACTVSGKAMILNKKQG